MHRVGWESGRQGDTLIFTWDVQPELITLLGSGYGIIRLGSVFRAHTHPNVEEVAPNHRRPQGARRVHARSGVVDLEH